MTVRSAWCDFPPAADIVRTKYFEAVPQRQLFAFLLPQKLVLGRGISRNYRRLRVAMMDGKDAGRWIAALERGVPQHLDGGYVRIDRNKRFLASCTEKQRGA